MSDIDFSFPPWAYAALTAFLFAPFVIGGAVPIVAGAWRRRPRRGLVLAAAALLPAALFSAAFWPVVPNELSWLARAQRPVTDAPIPQIASLVIGAVGAFRLLTARPARG